MKISAKYLDLGLIIQDINSIKLAIKINIEAVNKMVLRVDDLEEKIEKTQISYSEMINKVLDRIEYYDRVYKKTIKYHEEQVQINKLRAENSRYVQSIKDIKNGKNTI